LLEIIGNSKNVSRLQKHFKKMFAGVASITLNEDNSQVLGLLSKEGEEVRYLGKYILPYSLCSDDLKGVTRFSITFIQS